MGAGGRIRVVIADDPRLFWEGFRMLLSQEAGIELVGEAADGLQAIEVISNLRPDVVLLDITLPGMDGLEVIRPIKQNSPETKPLMLTAAMDETAIFKVLKAGAKGYLSKDASISDLIKAIQAVHHGELWVERKLFARFFDGEAFAEVKREDRPGRSREALTPREEEVLRLLASGRTNKEIT